jgi:hypothetical protein
VVGEKRKADELSEDPPSANGNIAAASGGTSSGGGKHEKGRVEKKLKLAAEKFTDSAKKILGRSKTKREKKPAAPVGRTERKTRSQGAVDH